MTVLTPAEIYWVATQSGWTGATAIVATAIAMAESGSKTDAVNDNGDSKDWGLWQINDKAHPDLFQKYPSLKTDPIQNGKAAYAVYQERGNTFIPWVVFTTKDPDVSYSRFLYDAQQGSRGGGTPVAGGFAPAPNDKPYVINGVTLKDNAWKEWLTSAGKAKPPTGLIPNHTLQKPGVIIDPRWNKNTERITLADRTTIEFKPTDDLTQWGSFRHAGTGGTISTISFDKSQMVVDYIDAGGVSGDPGGANTGGANEEGIPQIIGDVLGELFGGVGSFTNVLWIGGGAILVILGFAMIFKSSITGTDSNGGAFDQGYDAAVKNYSKIVGGE